MTSPASEQIQTVEKTDAKGKQIVVHLSDLGYQRCRSEEVGGRRPNLASSGIGPGRSRSGGIGILNLDDYYLYANSADEVVRESRPRTQRVPQGSLPIRRRQRGSEERHEHLLDDVEKMQENFERRAQDFLNSSSRNGGKHDFDGLKLDDEIDIVLQHAANSTSSQGNGKNFHQGSFPKRRSDLDHFHRRDSVENLVDLICTTEDEENQIFGKQRAAKNEMPPLNGHVSDVTQSPTKSNIVENSIEISPFPAGENSHEDLMKSQKSNATSVNVPLRLRLTGNKSSSKDDPSPPSSSGIDDSRTAAMKTLQKDGTGGSEESAAENNNQNLLPNRGGKGGEKVVRKGGEEKTSRIENNRENSALQEREAIQPSLMARVASSRLSENYNTERDNLEVLYNRGELGGGSERYSTLDFCFFLQLN